MSSKWRANHFDQLRHRSFAARYLTLFGGETFSKLCVMAAFAYLAHVLPPGEYGTIEWALAVTVFFVLGVESGMGLYGARIVAATPERVPQLVPQVMVLRLVLAVPAFAVILALAAYYRAAGVGLLAINGMAVLLTPLLTQWVFQGLRQMQWVATGTAIRNFLFVVLVIALVRRGSDIRLVALAEVLAIAALAVFNTIVLVRVLRVRVDWRDLGAGVRRVFRDVWFMGLSDFTWACLWYSPALIVAWLGRGMEDVAWVAASVRIVLALHTFVWLYFFNMLPNMAKALATSGEDWRALVGRSMAASMWPANLLAVGGTLIAPLLLPALFGEAYRAAVLPFQIVIWMIPVAWFSGHFRFSLIAAGHQRWEFAVSAATAVVTITATAILARLTGAVGAAEALLIGGIVNTVLAVAASSRWIGPVPIVQHVGPAVLVAAICLGIGLVLEPLTGVLASTVVACSAFVAAAARHDNELARLVRRIVTTRR